MAGTLTKSLDANEAAASVAYRMNEVIAIYPITPASPMGEFCDEWSAAKKPNLWGRTPSVAEMQSEAGAAGTVHGSLQAGALTTTFTASQGLLLMLPNMFKIAGELSAFCIHVAARTIATHALSIFGDHSDVMTARTTGFAMLCSNSVQEAHDFACIGQAASLQSRIPVLHFFDGFRTSHEVQKISMLGDDDLRAMIDEQWIADHRARALSPDHPVIRGTAQNPDTFFQAREACNPFYDSFPDAIQQAMDRFKGVTGRAYRIFDYVGHPEARKVLILMGSGCETADETIRRMADAGERVGLIKVRLFRPFSKAALLDALPKSVEGIAVLDRTKEPGAPGEPLYLDVVATLREAGHAARIIGGRYGLSSKEFTPSMVQAVLRHIDTPNAPPQFTVGIRDDVTQLSINYDPAPDHEPDDVARAVFYGLGSDGTVGANKNSIKVIGTNTDKYVQGYFVYDSKKSGARTVSHLRISPRPIQSAYLIRQASFVACHHEVFLDRYDVLEHAAPGAVFLLNTQRAPDTVWESFSREVQQQIADKKLRIYVIDALKVAGEAGLGSRINTVMQTCFFKLSNVIDFDLAVGEIKKTIRTTYGRKGDEIVKRNLAAVDSAVEHLYPVDVPQQVSATRVRPSAVSEHAPDLVQKVTAMMLADQGDLLPVSAFPPDGTWATATSKWEKRNIATEIPIWDTDVCIQCNKCALVCPHAAIRTKVYEPEALAGAPATFKSDDYNAKDLRGLKYTVQVAPEDCTGCHLCVEVCPAKNKANPRRKAINMEPHADHVDRERAGFEFFENLPQLKRDRIVRLDAKGSQFLEPLFEFSGACAGCGETPYVKLLTQLFGDRLLIANATGCSSIYGGNLPTTPYCTNAEGRGPAWANSLFEDNAEFGFGFRLACDQHTERAATWLQSLKNVDSALINQILEPTDTSRIDMSEQRARLTQVRDQLRSNGAATGADELLNKLVPKSVWLVGGDGWAYDIGFGGLDHVLASMANVNILVLDTEVYSNTGGQQSKATPLGAAAKFATAGKEIHKKDLGLIAMSYGHAYVASIAFGANENHTVKAFLEAESYPGPSIIIAYSHCIAHGYDMRHGAEQQKRAVKSGVWPLYRFDPRRIAEGQPPLQLDSGAITGSVTDYMNNEARFRMVQKIDPERFRRFAKLAKAETERRLEIYQQLAKLHVAPSQQAEMVGASANGGESR
ncbi:MAG: pyruvate:ferredoxin (flavodoxin) oxidoreductase [Phycisphaerales bacterium]|nr:pyruvate:ferredoxin (flavodoxin) oxidoreductase [Phycisphaerales bacterium]